MSSALLVWAGRALFEHERNRRLSAHRLLAHSSRSRAWRSRQGSAAGKTVQPPLPYGHRWPARGLIVGLLFCRSPLPVGNRLTTATNSGFKGWGSAPPGRGIRLVFLHNCFVSSRPRKSRPRNTIMDETTALRPRHAPASHGGAGLPLVLHDGEGTDRLAENEARLAPFHVASCVVAWSRRKPL
jgi:hypothetical protein